MDLNIALVKATCNGLFKYRGSLFGYEAGFGANVMKAAGSAAKNFMEGIGLLSKDSANTPAEVWDIRKIPKETKFFQACHIVLESLDSIKINHFSREELNLLMRQLTQKEVLISFYGDTSVGKSTLLNGIMEDWYLPVELGAETAVSVKIFFKQFDDENSDSRQNVDKLYKSGSEIAKGPLNIRKAIQVHNTKSRFKEEDVGDIELHLSHKFGQDVNQDPEIVLLDNPGCDENGSDFIIGSVERAKRWSAAFIFVTTFEQYRTMACSKALQNIFLQNPDIIKEKRLAVVINKMDQIFVRRPGHASYTKEKVIDEVHHFFCQKIFGCDEKQIAKDYIFLVCGTWAFYGRMYKKDRDEFEYGVEKEISNIKDMKELYPLIKGSVNRETPVETKAKYLDKLSSIDELEERLKLMAASSLQLWKCKMTSDIMNILQDTVHSIAEEITRETNSVEEIEQRIKPYYEVISCISELYCTTIKEQKKCKKRLPHSLLIAKLFKEACKKDHDKEDNFNTILLKTSQEAIELFKTDTSHKIKRGGYNAERLMDDLIPLMNDISKKISVHLSSWDVMSNLIEAYSCKSVQIWKETVNLRESLSRVVLNKDWHPSMKETPISYPKLTGPDLKVSLELPLDLPFKKKIWIFLQNFFRRKKIEIPKLKIIIEGNDSLDETQRKTSTMNEDNPLHNEDDQSGNDDLDDDSDSTLLKRVSHHEDSPEDSDARSTSYSSLNDDDDSNLGELVDNELSKSNRATSQLSDNKSGSFSSSSSQLGGSNNFFGQMASSTSALDIEVEHISVSVNQPARDESGEARNSGIRPFSVDRQRTVAISEVVKLPTADDKDSPVPRESVDNLFDSELNEEYSDNTSASAKIFKVVQPTTEDDINPSTTGNFDSEHSVVQKSGQKQSEAMFQKVHSGDSGSDDLAPSISFHLFTSNNNNAEMSASEATEMRGIGLNLLDELTKQLKEHVRRNITSFVQNMNTNIVLVYCRTYYDAAICTLKEFDKSAAKDLVTAETYLETNVRALEFHRESIKSLNKKLSAIRIMIEQFASVSTEAKE